jgi:lipopolysaccharide transport system ATP-binding protein
MRVFGGLGLQAGDTFDDDEDAELLDDELEELLEPREDKKTVAVDHVSFSVAGGGCVGIIGPPKSGKTTLMNIVAGITPPTSGRVVVHGFACPIVDSALPLFPRTGTFGKGLGSLGAFLHVPPRQIRRHLDEIFEFVEKPELRQKATTSVSSRTHREILFAMMLTLDPDIVLIDSPIPKPISARVRTRLTDFKASGGLVLMTGPNVKSVAWLADRVITLEGGAIARDERVEDALERWSIEKRDENGDVAAEE